MDDRPNGSPGRLDLDRLLFSRHPPEALNSSAGMRSVFLAAAVAGLVFCDSARAQRERLTPEDLETVEHTWPNAKKTSTGIRYVVLKEGRGRLAGSGDYISVLYRGRLLDGTPFDAQLDPAHAFRFRLDRGFVIRGWDQILQQMRVGEKRVVIIPADLAYGARGSPPKIPRDAVLVFDVELIKDEPES